MEFLILLCLDEQGFAIFLHRKCFILFSIQVSFFISSQTSADTFFPALSCPVPLFVWLQREIETHLSVHSFPFRWNITMSVSPDLTKTESPLLALDVSLKPLLIWEKAMPVQALA